MGKEIARWKAEQANKPPEKKQKVSEQKKAPAVPLAEVPVAVASTKAKEVPGGVDFKAFVDVPTMEDIERLLLEKKKQAVLNKYASAEMQAKGKESSELVLGSKDTPVAPGTPPDDAE